MNEKINETSLDTLCAALAEIIGVEPPKQAAKANEALVNYANEKLGGEKADRIFMYNPDAVAQWIVEKYPDFITMVTSRCELSLPMRSPMPSVTPVCFGTMYTGAQPEVHGIQKYEKPVIKIDTLFDALVRGGKKVAIVAGSPRCSLANIFLEREAVDYYIMANVEEVNAKAAELIIEDKHDFILAYNGNFDATRHRTAPRQILLSASFAQTQEPSALLPSLSRRDGRDTTPLWDLLWTTAATRLTAAAARTDSICPRTLISRTTIRYIRRRNTQKTQ